VQFREFEPGKVNLTRDTLAFRLSMQEWPGISTSRARCNLLRRSNVEDYNAHRFIPNIPKSVRSTRRINDDVTGIHREFLGTGCHSAMTGDHNVDLFIVTAMSMRSDCATRWNDCQIDEIKSAIYSLIGHSGCLDSTDAVVCDYIFK